MSEPVDVIKKFPTSVDLRRKARLYLELGDRQPNAIGALSSIANVYATLAQVTPSDRIAVIEQEAPGLTIIDFSNGARISRIGKRWNEVGWRGDRAPWEQRTLKDMVRQHGDQFTVTLPEEGDSDD